MMVVLGGGEARHAKAESGLPSTALAPTPLATSRAARRVLAAVVRELNGVVPGGMQRGGRLIPFGTVSSVRRVRMGRGGGAGGMGG